MALPPTIPTSFVPHSSGASARPFRSDFIGAFGILSYVVLGLVFLAALGVFFYGRILSAEQSAKDATLEEQVRKIDRATVESFVQLRDRLNFGDALLEKHIAFSKFFTLLGTLLPATVRFSSLHISLDSFGVAKIDASGNARSFNALAAASTAFAESGHFKDAIFSSITVTKDNAISFKLSASLDPKIIIFSL